MNKKYIPFGIAVLIALAALIVLLPLFMADVYFQRARAAARDASGNENPGQGEAAFQKAESLFGTALFWDDDNPEIYRGLGDLYLRASHTELESFLKAHRVKKIIRSQPPVKLKEKQGDEVRDPAVKVKDLTPAEVKAQIQKGLQSDTRITEETVYITPPYPGSAYGYEQKAMRAYRAGISLNPLDARLVWGLAEMMQFKAPFEKTEAVFRKAVQLDPNNANIHFSFSLFYLRQKRRDQAIMEMRTTLAIYPFDADKVYAAWLAAGGLRDELKLIAGVSPTGLYRLGMWLERRKDNLRAADVFVAACRTIGGVTVDTRPNETPARHLLPGLLEALKRHGRTEEETHYRLLWGAALELPAE